MKDSIFRKQSIERISSPEETKDYLRVMNPGKWLIAGVILLLFISGILYSGTMIS